MPTGAEFCALCKSRGPCLKSTTHGTQNWSTTMLITYSGYTVLPPSSSIDPTKVSVTFVPPPSAAKTTPLRLLTNGEPEANIDEERASEILKEEDLQVEVDLGQGSEEARVWTCDFSHEYVTINGSVSADLITSNGADTDLARYSTEVDRPDEVSYSELHGAKDAARCDDPRKR